MPAIKRPVRAAGAARTCPLRLRLTPIFALLGALLTLAAVPALASAASVSWGKAVRIESVKDGGLNAVSCPSSAFCAAVDSSGNLVTSTRPTKGVWNSPVKIEPATDGGLTGISCPTAALCVAVDQSGNVLTSTNPTGGAKAWSKPARIDSTVGSGGGYAGLAAISCPSAKLCVAVDNAAAGNVVTSTNPTGGAKAWTVTKVGGLLDTVSCTYATTFCVIAGTQHYWSATSTGGATAWHATGAPTGGGVISGIACPSTTMCLGVGYGDVGLGMATSTATPRGSLSSWTTVSVSPDPPGAGQATFDAVSCATAKLCVAVDGADDAYTTTSPTTGVWGGGGAVRPKSASQWTSISCNPSICMVVDSAGVATTGSV
jgi:hypothetical protein